MLFCVLFLVKPDILCSKFLGHMLKYAFAKRENLLASRYQVSAKC